MGCSAGGRAFAATDERVLNVGGAQQAKVIEATIGDNEAPLAEATVKVRTKALPGAADEARREIAELTVQPLTSDAQGSGAASSQAAIADTASASP